MDLTPSSITKTDPGPVFEAGKPDLQDVYVTTLGGRLQEV